MTPETRYYLDKARQCLADAKTIAAIPIPQVAAKEAYLAGYHAAAAFILMVNNGFVQKLAPPPLTGAGAAA